MIDLKKIANSTGASQDKFELLQMLQTLSLYPPKQILEVGVHTGFNLKTLGEAFPDARLVGIESDPTFLQFTDFELLVGDSADPNVLGMARSRGLYDFIFIDGDHRYEAAKADWENYSKMVAPGGIIGFHDTSRMGEGWMSKVEVRRLLDEIWASNSYPCVEFFNGRENPGIALFWL